MSQNEKAILQNIVEGKNVVCFHMVDQPLVETLTRIIRELHAQVISLQHSDSASH